MNNRDASPLGLTCKNCGLPVEFDIVRQSYRCPACGSERAVEEFPAEVRSWTARNRARRAAQGTEYPGPS